MKRLTDLVAPALLLIGLVALWEGACRALQIPPLLLPPPSAVATALADRWPSLLAAGWNTIVMALSALAVASLVAMPVGLAVGLSPTLGRAVRPLAIALQVTPVIAIAPLVVIWFGLDHSWRAVVALGAIMAFFPIFSGLLTGLKSADRDLERLFDLYGAKRTDRLVKLRLPASTPYLLEGHKVATGLAVIGSVVAEWVAGSGQTQGLAWRILEASNRLRTAEMFAAVLVLALLALGLHALMSAMEREALKRWSGRPR